MKPVFFVGCAHSKGDEACAARDLYTSHLFQLAREFAEACGARWFILSAKHGLVRPSQILAPYNLPLSEMSPAEREQWGRRVRAQLIAEGFDFDRDRFTILAGRRYREALSLPPQAFTAPLAGLGIGHQKQRLKQWIADLRSKAVTA